MIRVELPVIVLIYFFVLLAALFSLSIVYEWRNQKREKEVLRYRVHCTICASIFEDRTSAELIRCPRCGSLNERQKTGGL
jgi:rRNA maturation endonuclease Nob1